MTISGVDRLPDIDVSPVSERADLMATSLLEAYYFQDQRESYLLQGKPDAAMDAARNALSRMARVYEEEFPERSAQRSRMAGKEFMKGLFLQDEIENWDLITQTPEGTYLQEALFSDPREPYGPTVGRDERWEWVRDHLRTACDKVDIGPDYADKQAQFWLLHGQLDEYWEEIAKEAHTVKLRAMVDEPPAAAENALGEFFVEGVKQHDGWDHRDRERDLDSIQDVVARYYQRILDLRV